MTYNSYAATRRLLSWRVETELRASAHACLAIQIDFKVSVGVTVVYEISVKIRQAEKFAPHLTKILRREYDFNFTTTIVVIMGRRLPDEVVHRIRLRVEADKSVAAITEAVKVSKKIIYKLWLNLDI